MQARNPTAPTILTVLAAAIVLSFGIQRPANAGGHHGYHVGHHGHAYGYGHRHGYRYFGGHHYGYRPYVGYNYGYRPHIGNYAHSRHPDRTYDSRMQGAAGDGNASSGGNGGTYGIGVPAPGNTSAATTDNRGWARLAEGRYDEAITFFADQANNAPLNGQPKIGYALAAAGAGDLNRGAWAMRRALSIDPQAFHYVTANDGLKSRISELITRYVESPKGAVQDTEAALMVASLHYLLRQADPAREAIKAALATDGPNAATLNLSRMIERDLSPASAPTGNGSGEAPHSSSSGRGDN